MAQEVAEDFRAGAGKKLWQLERDVSQNRKSRAQGLIPVLRDAKGEIVQDDERLPCMWEEKYVQEFTGRAVILEPPMKAGKTTGQDNVPVETMRASGTMFVRGLAEVATATQWSQTPASWQLDWLCMECAKCFASRRAVLEHSRRPHGVRRTTGLFVVGPTCPSCGENVHARIRVKKHLEMGASACRLALQARTLPLQDPELVREANEQDRCRQQARMPEVYSRPTKSCPPSTTEAQPVQAAFGCRCGCRTTP